MTAELNRRPIKVFPSTGSGHHLCHYPLQGTPISIPLWDADTLRALRRVPVRGLYTRLTKDGVDTWLDKEKLLPGQDWKLEIRKAVRKIVT